MTFIKFVKTFYFKAKYLFHAALIYAKDLKICEIYVILFAVSPSSQLNELIILIPIVLSNWIKITLIDIFFY